MFPWVMVPGKNRWAERIQNYTDICHRIKQLWVSVVLTKTQGNEATWQNDTRFEIIVLCADLGFFFKGTHMVVT